MATQVTSTAIADPHIETFRGDRFDFMGEYDLWYCFLSAKSVLMNVKMRTFEGQKTYIVDVGIVIAQASETRQVRATLEDGWIVVNGNTQPFGTVTFSERPKKLLKINTGEYQISISRGEEMYGDKVCPHINVGIEVGEIGVLSEGVEPHGVMGQFALRTKGIPRQGSGKQGEGFIDGKYTDYEVAGPFDTNFRYNRFGTEPTVTPQMGVGGRTRSVSHL